MCSNSDKFYGNTIQASRKLLTNHIDTVDKNRKQISIGGWADSVKINGDLIVTGDNCANCLQTNDPDVNVHISGSNPPSTGQALLATSATTAEWQTVSGTGDVVGPASSTDNEIVRYDGVTGKLIKSDATDPTTIDDNGLFSGPLIETNNNLVALGSGISKNAGTGTTVMGNNAGSALTSSGLSNTLVGFNTGANTTDGDDNTFIGSFAGFENTSGLSNTFIGRSSGSNNTTGDDNVFIGRESGVNNTTGIQNTLLGFESGRNITTQSGCVLLGNQTGFNNTLDNRLMIDNTSTNTPLLDGDFTNDILTVNGDLIVTGENEADRLRTTGASVVIGTSAPPTTGQALLATSATTAEWQTVSGSGTGDVVGPASSTDNEIVRYDSTTGKLIKSDGTDPTTIDDNGLFSGPTIETSSDLVGLGSGISKLAGLRTTVMGNNAGSALTGSAYNNTLIGSSSGSNNTGIFNTFVGAHSGISNTSGNNNTFIGNSSGSSKTTGDDNVFIGQSSGLSMTTQTGCVLIGAGCGASNTLSNRLMIDNSTTNTPLLDGDFTNDTLTINGDLTVTGENEADRLRTTGASVVVGTSAPPTTGQALLATSATTAEWQTVSGSGTGDVVGPANSTNNEIVRFDSTTGKLIKSDGTDPTTIDDNGNFSGPLIETNLNIVSFGDNISKVAGTGSTIMGNDAGTVLTISATNNTFIGNRAGRDTTIGDDNTFIGSSSGINNTDGLQNVFIGSSSGLLNTNGFENTFVGTFAGRNNTTGQDNVFIGKDSGFSINTGQNNTFIGKQTGQNMTTQSGCVLLGNEAGFNNTLNNRLMIDNSTTNTPLLDGNFANDTLIFNAQTTIGDSTNPNITHNLYSNTNATATAGGSTLPANPDGFIIINLNGTNVKIPYYPV